VRQQLHELVFRVALVFVFARATQPLVAHGS
jgi:hypothetical protein